jgi:hypothetical protein
MCHPSQGFLRDYELLSHALEHNYYSVVSFSCCHGRDGLAPLTRRNVAVERPAITVRRMGPPTRRNQRGRNQERHAHTSEIRRLWAVPGHPGADIPCVAGGSGLLGQSADRRHYQDVLSVSGSTTSPHCQSQGTRTARRAPSS